MTRRAILFCSHLERHWTIQRHWIHDRSNLHVSTELYRSSYQRLQLQLLFSVYTGGRAVYWLFRFIACRWRVCRRSSVVNYAFQISKTYSESEPGFLLANYNNYTNASQQNALCQLKTDNSTFSYFPKQ